jgi:hypothetical protein
MARKKSPDPGARKPNVGISDRAAANGRAGRTDREARRRRGWTEMHPATSDPPYTDEETEFFKACVLYAQTKFKPFLLARDYLAILKQLGYRKP